MTALEVGAACKGWLPLAEAKALHRTALTVPNPVFPWVELGSYCGKSACYLGDAARQVGTHLFTIDHHRGSPEMAPGRECHDPDVMHDGEHDTLPHLRRTLREAGLEDVVFPIVAPTTVPASAFGTVGLVFIDAGHDQISVSLDCAHWAWKITPGGVLAMHDTTDANITPTADQALAQGFELIEQVESLRLMRRP